MPAISPADTAPTILRRVAGRSVVNQSTSAYDTLRDVVPTPPDLLNPLQKQLQHDAIDDR